MKKTADFPENVDNSKYNIEARIYSVDGKIQKVFSDDNFLLKINECEHPISLYHISKGVINEIEKAFAPLKNHSSKLILETKGGSVTARMPLEVFFELLEISKKITISDRFQETQKQETKVAENIEQEIQDFEKMCSSVFETN